MATLTTGILSTTESTERARRASEAPPPPVSAMDKILGYLRFAPFDTLAVGDYLIGALFLILIRSCS